MHANGREWEGRIGWEEGERENGRAGRMRGTGGIGGAGDDFWGKRSSPSPLPKNVRMRYDVIARGGQRWPGGVCMGIGKGKRGGLGRWAVEEESEMTCEEAWSFAREWIEAWNGHDLERILSHYAEDFEMTSPFVAAVMHQSDGTLRGKEQVGRYWARALEQLPDLHFTLLDVLAGVGTVTLYYEGALNKRAAEVFFFDETGKVCKAIAHYQGAG